MAGTARRFLSGVAREFDPRDPFLKDTGSRNLNNLWTGKTLGGRAKLLGAVAGVAYAGNTINNAAYKAIGQEAEQQDMVSLPGTRGDMMEYTPGHALPEVQGNLVFALNKLRHGG